MKSKLFFPFFLLVGFLGIFNQSFADVPVPVVKTAFTASSPSTSSGHLISFSWAVENGYGTQEDLECTEEYGAIQGADPDAVSDRAYERGTAQSGTLGSGNHFLEVQEVESIYDEKIKTAKENIDADTSESTNSSNRIGIRNFSTVNLKKAGHYDI